MLIVDRIEARVLAALSAGAQVDPDEQRAEFEKWLASPLEAEMDPERYELLVSLGLRR